VSFAPGIFGLRSGIIAVPAQSPRAGPVANSLDGRLVLHAFINCRVEPLKKNKNGDKRLVETGKAVPHDEAASTVDKHPFA
jgi:hypothetical protein